MSAYPNTLPPTPSGIKTIYFDLQGTCTNWLPSIVRALSETPALPDPSLLPSSEYENFAKGWRAGFFQGVQARLEAGQGVEDVDVTHRRALNYLLMQRGITPAMWGEEVRRELVSAWGVPEAWPDTVPALQRLRKEYYIITLANGTLPLQISITNSPHLTSPLAPKQEPHLPFHSLLPSSVLGHSKPDPRAYRKALSLMSIEANEAMMVAGHAYDLRGAKAVGMKTAYIQRTTEDPEEDMALVRKENDFFFDGTKGNEECGLSELADVLGV